MTIENIIEEVKKVYPNNNIELSSDQNNKYYLVIDGVKSKFLITQSMINMGSSNIDSYQSIIHGVVNYIKNEFNF